jgi:hypothetical protein
VQRWRRWQIDCLEYVVRANLQRISEAMRLSPTTYDRIARFNPTLNGIVEVLANEKLASADAADAAVRADHELGPLHGMPVTECWRVRWRRKMKPGTALNPSADLDNQSNCQK